MRNKREADKTFPEGSEAIEYATGDENSAMLKTLYPYDQNADMDLVTDLPGKTPVVLALFELYAKREGLTEWIDYSEKLKRLIVSRDRIGRQEGLSVINWAWAGVKREEEKEKK
jgi:hypothetical protein